MAAPSPVFVEKRFGIAHYKISQQLYTDVEGLFEIMYQRDVVEQGAFVAEMEMDNLHERTTFTETIKADLRRDNCQSEMSRAHRIQVDAKSRKLRSYKVTTHHPSDADQADSVRLVLEEKRREFLEGFLQTDLNLPQKNTLQDALDLGVDTCLDTLFRIMETRSRKHQLWYLPNITPTTATGLDFAPHCDMRDMRSQIHHLGPRKPAGIVTPTVYVGSEGAPFACHIEDLAFEAVNQQVAGGNKVWFVIPPTHHNAFCDVLASLGFTQAEGSCRYLLNHKHCFVDPRTILKAGIPVRTIVQRPGQIVYLFPHAIHWGFNVSYNVNQAVNVATKSWALCGVAAQKPCNCPTLEKTGKLNPEALFKVCGVTPQMRADWKKNLRHEAMEQLRRTRPLLYPALHRQQVEPIPASCLLGHDGTDEQEDLDLGDDDTDNPPTDFEQNGPEQLQFQTTTQTHGQNILCPLCTASMGHKHNDTGRDRLRRHAFARHLHCADAVVQEYDRQAAVMPVPQKECKGEAIPCKFCEQIYHGKAVYKHEKTCPQRPETSQDTRPKRSRTSSQ